MTITTPLLAGDTPPPSGLPAPRPEPIPNLDRLIAVRRVLVHHLVNTCMPEELGHVISALLTALGPHLAVNPPPTPESPTPQLTPHQIQVLQLVAAGRGNRAIGHALGITEDTVKTHMRRILTRLPAHDRAHAVAIGYRTGLLP